MSSLALKSGASPSPLRPLVTTSQGEQQVVWRGESSGEMFEHFELSHTQARVGFFFAEQQALAAGYAKHGTQARAFTLSADRVLDLQDPYAASVRAFVGTYSDQFDEWVDRYSGESMDVQSFLGTGSLYDYEGTGSASRWNALFEAAWDQGYDAVRVYDSTDGIPMGVVWVVRHADQITFVTTPAPTPTLTRARRSTP